MKYLIYTIAIILLVAVNYGLFPLLRIGGAIPNLLFLFVVLYALQRNNEHVIFIALVSGLFVDFYNGLLVGGYTLAFVLLGYILYQFIHEVAVYELDWKYTFLIVALSFLASKLWRYFITCWRCAWAGWGGAWSSTWCAAIFLRSWFIT